jgi:hypothetical protein
LSFEALDLLLLLVGMDEFDKLKWIIATSGFRLRLMMMNSICSIIYDGDMEVWTFGRLDSDWKVS